jgi:hypothetical protein
MKSIVFVVFSLVLLNSFCAEARLKTNRELRQGGVSSVEIQEGQRLRAFEAAWWPAIQPRAIALTGVQVQRTGQQSAEVDAVLFALSTWLETSLAFAYFHGEASVGTDVNGNVTSQLSGSLFAFALRMFHVFEFDDLDANGYYNENADNITGYYDLSSGLLTWKPMNIDSFDLQSDEGTYKVFIVDVETADEVFYMRFIAAGHPSDVTGVKITPDSIKVDIRIRWFNNPLYTGATLYATGPSDANAHPNAQVGLTSAMGALAAAAVASQGTATNNPALTFQGGSVAGFFSWEDEAGTVVNGVEAARAVTGTVVPVDDPTVQAAFTAGWLLRIMIFSFQGARASEVNWDPEAGASIDYEALNSAAMTVQPAFYVAFFAILFILFARK